MYLKKKKKHNDVLFFLGCSDFIDRSLILFLKRPLLPEVRQKIDAVQLPAHFYLREQCFHRADVFTGRCQTTVRMLESSKTCLT